MSTHERRSPTSYIRNPCWGSSRDHRRGRPPSRGWNSRPYPSRRPYVRPPSRPHDEFEPRHRSGRSFWPPRGHWGPSSSEGDLRTSVASPGLPSNSGGSHSHSSTCYYGCRIDSAQGSSSTSSSGGSLGRPRPEVVYVRHHLGVAPPGSLAETLAMFGSGARSIPPCTPERCTVAVPLTSPAAPQSAGVGVGVHSSDGQIVP